MADASINVKLEYKRLTVTLEKNDDDQRATVKAAERVSLTVSDRVTVNQLNVGGGGGGGTSFLPIADLCEDTNATYFYFGWTDQGTSGNWLIRRANRSTLVELDADLATDGGYADLAAAWVDKATLNYA